MFDGRLAEAPNQVIVQMLIVSSVRADSAVLIVAAIAEIPHDPAFGLIDDFGASGLWDVAAKSRESIGLGHEPP